MGEDRALSSLPAIRTWEFDTPRCSGTMSRAGSPSQLAEVTAEEIKDTLNAHQVTASGFVWMHSAHMLKQIRKALRVNDALREVLDERASHAVLEHPSLKPLLAEASD
jgi:hypothetical protein